MKQSQQPQLLRELREKALEIQLSLDKVIQNKKQNALELQNMKKQNEKYKIEKDVQERKYKSLIVLLNQLQRTYHESYLEDKNDSQDNQKLTNLENSFIRSILIKQSQNVKQMQKLLSFMKQFQLNKNNIKSKEKEWIKKSKFIENQAQTIAKLRAQLNLFRNENLECKRKWFQLQQQNRKFQNEEKILKIQLERQKTQIKEQYENYLERINDSKTKIVTFNETQRQNVITDYFVQEISLLQQKRVQLQEKNHDLLFHFQNLNEESQKIRIENQQLMSFLTMNDQEAKLATKMKKRIDELRDTLLQQKKKNRNERMTKLTKITQYIRSQLKKNIEANDFMEVRIREQEDKGMCLQDKPIAQFFSKVLERKDKELVMSREQENILKEKRKELQINKELIENQIQNLQQNLDFNSYERKPFEGF